MKKGWLPQNANLGNESFLAKAPHNVVEGLKKQESETRHCWKKHAPHWMHCQVHRE